MECIRHFLTLYRAWRAPLTAKPLTAKALTAKISAFSLPANLSSNCERYRALRDRAAHVQVLQQAVLQALGPLHAQLGRLEGLGPPRGEAVTPGLEIAIN